LFLQSENARIVLNAIHWLKRQHRFLVDAAVLMPDHLHLVGALGEATLPEVMHSLKSYTANKLSRAGIITPVWQEGYHDQGLRDNGDYRARLQYLLYNPVRAGLARRVREYPHIILPDWWED
jgi:REP element-mobilizing transposase RayT